jgi:hypothetical protein
MPEKVFPRHRLVEELGNLTSVGGGDWYMIQDPITGHVSMRYHEKHWRTDLNLWCKLVLGEQEEVFFLAWAKANSAQVVCFQTNRCVRCLRLAEENGYVLLNATTGFNRRSADTCELEFTFADKPDEKTYYYHLFGETAEDLAATFIDLCDKVIIIAVKMTEEKLGKVLRFVANRKPTIDVTVHCEGASDQALYTIIRKTDLFFFPRSYVVNSQSQWAIRLPYPWIRLAIALMARGRQKGTPLALLPDDLLRMALMLIVS